MTSLCRQASVRPPRLAGCGGTFAFVLSLVTLVCCAAADRVSASEQSDTRLSLGVAVHQRAVDTMSYSDIRPGPRGEVGGRIELGYRIAKTWWLTSGVHLGGAWFDFSGPSTSGKIEDFGWLLRVSVEHHHALGGGRNKLYAGVGAEYGEARSWLNTFSSNDEGPHVFSRGGHIKAGFLYGISGSAGLFAEVVQSVTWSHARQARPQNDFNWLGRAFEGAVGVRVGLWPRGAAVD